ncbi:MAG: hypothetical protein AVDCRST_MAG33-1123 [uncultured Thermomicrobiales bacterium]|uniref:Nitroreductase family deazaflavin-dependent oxidoreductase n=1 Tax=uncultured Thermomicrobiales bacterium TaxID=1645740 RepID=A0A6J4UQS7_9BACT|nr:MAG: hypothetical protein AVDCRST_MAG33-1123 [uncultured Thermomicrobiales bacterium]
MATPGDTRPRQPGWFLRHVANPVVSILVRLGVMPARIQLLCVAGRRSGRVQAVPLTPVDLGGKTYLVSPRGEMAWVQNLRAAGKAELRQGRRMRRITARELPVYERAAVLRQYVRENRVAAGGSFTAKGADATLSDFADEAERHPVFAVSFTDVADRRR